MVVIYALLFLLLFLIVLDLTRGLRFRFSAHFDRERSKFEATLLYPFLRILFEPKSDAPKPKIYIMGIDMSRSFSKKKKQPDVLKLAGSLHISNIEFVAAYGIADPCSTGIVFGALNFIMSFCSNIKKAETYPDFFTAHNYLRLNASVDIQVGHTMLDYLRK
jgi:hypothetical protein